MILSSDLRYVLKELRPSESVWDAAKRLHVFDQERYSKLQGQINNPQRIRDPIAQAAVNRSYTVNVERDKNWSQCERCWKLLVKATFREYGPLCSCCGARDHVSAHHITPRSEGGPNEVFNLIPLCEICHNYVECLEPLPKTREEVIRRGRDR